MRKINRGDVNWMLTRGIDAFYHINKGHRNTRIELVSW